MKCESSWIWMGLYFLSIEDVKSKQAGRKKWRAKATGGDSFWMWASAMTITQRRKTKGTNESSNIKKGALSQIQEKKGGW